jgi:hypothetical protein
MVNQLFLKLQIEFKEMVEKWILTQCLNEQVLVDTSWLTSLKMEINIYL